MLEVSALAQYLFVHFLVVMCFSRMLFAKSMLDSFK